MTESYKTIKTTSEGTYKEKGSKFMAFALPVNSVDEVKEIVRNYRKEYYDARHVCYAYVLGPDKSESRANDDGEPSGTAGRPILGQINSFGLTNVLVVVVRYFGGILLGTGGLATAYKEASADALNSAEIIDKTVENSISIQFGYLQMNDVMRIVKDTNARITKQDFDNVCKIDVSIDQHDMPVFISKMEKIGGVGIDVGGD
ncbi:MAG TPA: YigZ family protein [Paludibacter sp.]|nr:YigZ family protein [Paludibacter sp.]